MFILAFFLLRIRRMASTFADPVNLGAFLLAVFLVSWHRGKGIICVLMAIGMLLMQIGRRGFNGYRKTESQDHDRKIDRKSG